MNWIKNTEATWQVLLSLSGLLLGQGVFAALNAGDIAFVQYNADNPDNFAFVVLVDINAGEEIKFTDKGWKSDNTWYTYEGIITWTAPTSGVSAGAIVTIFSIDTYPPTPTSPSASLGSVSKLSSGTAFSMNFATDGDQLIAYQNTDTMIAALNNEGSATWQADATTSSASARSNTSALPKDLTNGTNAVALTEIDNAQYKGITVGTKAELLAAINNSANWAGSNDTNQTFSNTFTITDPEPTNHPTDFSATTDSSSQITTRWTDSTSGQIPAGYLVLCSTTNAFINPVDNTAQTNDADCSDGSGIKNITQGMQTVAWTGLTADTAYYFKIFPYTNSDININYKIDGTPLTATATTSGNNNDIPPVINYPTYVPPPPPAKTSVTVAFGGNGRGKITSIPSGLNCQSPNACSYTFQTDETIQLIPTPIGQSRFQNWGVGCNSGSFSPVGQSQHCMVYFVDIVTPNYVLTVNGAGVGQGVIITEGIDCGNDCTETFVENYQLTLSANAKENAQFLGWQGDCSGTDGVVGIVMDSDKNCTAVFDVLPEPIIPETEAVTSTDDQTIVDTEPTVKEEEESDEESIADELIVNEVPLVNVTVEEPVISEPPVNVTVEEPMISEPKLEEFPIPATVIPSLPEPSSKTQPCLPLGTLDYYCNAQGQTIGNLNITESSNSIGFLSNAVIIGTVTLSPSAWISNLQVTSTGVVIGGVVTGLNYNKGYLGDFEFRGEFIKGGMLGGFILNTSKIFSWFENVKLASGSHLIGGALKGKIQGDLKNPAWLENLRILSGSVVSGVIIGNGVKIDKNVEIQDSKTNDTPANEMELPALDEQFSAGISVNDSSYQTKNVAQILSDKVSIRGRIHANKNHLEQKANIFVTIAYRTNENHHEPFLFTVNHLNGLMPWDGKLSSIDYHPFRADETLQITQTIKIYEGLLLAQGFLEIRFGYVLEDGTVVQSAKSIALTTTD